MINANDIELFERIGYVNEDGRHVYGSAAVTHYTYCRVRDLDPAIIERGKAIVSNILKHLNA